MNVVNGHVILALFRFYNEGTKCVYSNKRDRPLNRNFELDINAKYDYDSICSTKIYSNMKVEKIVKIFETE